MNNMFDEFDRGLDKELKPGTIKDFAGNLNSGLWQIYFEDGSVCHIESGHGLRTLARVYGNLDKAIGKKIRYKTDDLNVMTYFEPTGE